jgi:hypothetical protein
MIRILFVCALAIGIGLAGADDAQAFKSRVKANYACDKAKRQNQAHFARQQRKKAKRERKQAEKAHDVRRREAQLLLTKEAERHSSAVKDITRPSQGMERFVELFADIMSRVVLRGMDRACDRLATQRHGLVVMEVPLRRTAELLPSGAYRSAAIPVVPRESYTVKNPMRFQCSSPAKEVEKDVHTQRPATKQRVIEETGPIN